MPTSISKIQRYNDDVVNTHKNAEPVIDRNSRNSGAPLGLACLPGCVAQNRHRWSLAWILDGFLPEGILAGERRKPAIELLGIPHRLQSHVVNALAITPDDHRHTQRYAPPGMGFDMHLGNIVDDLPAWRQFRNSARLIDQATLFTRVIAPAGVYSPARSSISPAPVRR